MSFRYDLVFFGATGFTGTHVVKAMVNNKRFEGVSFAVAGRSQAKLEKVLDTISQDTGVDIRSTPTIICSTDDDASLEAMARQATVIVNTVGPYTLHGDAVVKAAVHNGANHIDISGEPGFLLRCHLFYDEIARRNGVYVVGACGFDSIPCDLGVHFLKREFGGELNHVDTYIQTHTGEEGYTLNSGTYRSVLEAMQSAPADMFIGDLEKSVMPLEKPKRRHKSRLIPIGRVSEPELPGWTIPFISYDKIAVNLTEYAAYIKDNKYRPITISTHVHTRTLVWSILVVSWLSMLSLLVHFPPIRRFLRNNPERCSNGRFADNGPTPNQIKNTSITYWFFGYGHSVAGGQGMPDKRVVATCEGADPAYAMTSATLLSSALALLNDKDKLSEGGGVLTPATAFGDTRIYEYMQEMGVRLKKQSEGKAK